VHERVGRREPVGHPLGKALDPHAAAVEAEREARPQLFVPAAETDHERDLRKRQRDLDGFGEAAYSPAAA
jgi:hypothetical protein